MFRCLETRGKGRADSCSFCMALPHDFVCRHIRQPAAPTDNPLSSAQHKLCLRMMTPWKDLRQGPGGGERQCNIGLGIVDREARSNFPRLLQLTVTTEAADRHATVSKVFGGRRGRVIRYSVFRRDLSRQEWRSLHLASRHRTPDE